MVRATLVLTHEDDQRHVQVYLSGLVADSARVMGSAVDSVADIVSNGKGPTDKLPWHQLGPEHVSALRGRIQKLYASATANRAPDGPPSCPEGSWRLGLVDREPMKRGLEVPPSPPIKGARELRGRAVVRDELRAVFAPRADAANPTAGVT